MSDKILEPTAEMNELLRRSGSLRASEHMAAQAELAVALELPLRQAIFNGDITGNIFERIPLTQSQTAEFPLDIIAPGREKDFVAYTIPNHGRIPERNVDGDYVTVPTYEIGNSIDYTLKLARDTRWDIVSRAMNVLMAGFVKKINDDAWHCLLSAGLDRNIMVYDADATAGQFTKRLVSLMKTIVRRNGGGNSTSMNRGILTDLYVSPESMEDIRNWGVDMIDEVTRREIYVAADGAVNRVFNVNLHDLDELGVGQEYQNFYLNTLGGAVQGSDVELVVGLDLRANDSFIMPVRENISVYPDELMHRQRRAGWYGWGEYGFAALDNRRVVLGSL